MGVKLTRRPSPDPVSAPNVRPSETKPPPAGDPRSASMNAPVRQGAVPRRADPGIGTERAGLGASVSAMMGAAGRGLRNLAVAGAIVGMGFGLTGCSEPVPPSPGMDVQISLREGIKVTGETPDHAEFRIKVHTHANEAYGGVKWLAFADHAASEPLSRNALGQWTEMGPGELATLMRDAGVDPSEVQGVRGVETLADLIRFLEGGQTADERRAAWAKHLVETRDRDGSGGLSWSEFEPLLEVQSGPVR